MKSVKVSLNLSADVVNIVKELAEERSTTMTEVFRRAIGNEKFFDDAVKDGGKVLVEDRRGKLKQVVFR
jgi:predicted transcriptional regulator